MLPRHRLTGISATLFVVLLSACPVPFGYYTAGNEAVKEVQTSEAAPAIAVKIPVIHSAPFAGGEPIEVFGTRTEDRDQIITLSCDTEGASIYYTYTTDPQAMPNLPDPDPNRPLTGLFATTVPLEVKGHNTEIYVKAVAFKPLMLPSSVASVRMKISYTTASSPTFEFPGDFISHPTEDTYRYLHAFALTIKGSTPGSTVWYTIDGSEPEVNGQATLSGIAPVIVDISQTTQVRAVAIAPDFSTSSETSMSFELETEPPEFAPTGGSRNAAFTATITSPTPGSTIWYTLDGSQPIVGGGATLSGIDRVDVDISRTTQIRSVAKAVGFYPSLETGVTYELIVDPPVVSPAGGLMTVPFTATIAPQTAGSTVWYTVDGTDPDPVGHVGTESAVPVSLTLSLTTTVKAVGAKSGWTNSSLATQDYYFLPSVPAAPSASDGINQVVVAWSPAPNATSYNIYYRAGSSVTTLNGTKITGVTSPRTLAGLTGGTQYAVIVTGVNPYGESTASPTVTATSMFAAPSGFTVTPVSTQAFNAQWSAVSGATGYEIYSDTNPLGAFASLNWSGSTTTAVLGEFAATQTMYFKIRALGGVDSPTATGTTLASADMPTLTDIATGTYPAPTQLPAGAPSPDYWIRTVTLAWTQGPYTYLVWDRDYQNQGAFAIGAYDSAENLVGQWVITGNRYISAVTFDYFTGLFTFTGQYGDTDALWVNLKL